jgi:hypothetical protein
MGMFECTGVTTSEGGRRRTKDEADPFAQDLQLRRDEKDLRLLAPLFAMEVTTPISKRITTAKRECHIL